MTLQKEVKNMDKRIKQIKDDEELKYIDVLQGTANIPASGGSAQGLITLLNPAVTGDLPLNNREGGEIRCTSVQIRAHILTGSTAVTDFPTEFRCILFWDRQPNVSAPTLYTSGTGSGTMGLIDNTTITPIIHAPLNHQVSERYKVLYDKIFILNGTGSDDSVPVAKFLTIRKKLNRKTKYTKTAGVGSVTDIITNALYFVVFNGSGNDDSSAIWGSRVYFKDD